mmetsp:Transcript_48025/g.54452  ORF Transcript_48025/g.54452 Transcript_48025/m.54452 type:complete len:147 (-) Transcript_48025:679-1119(-)
MVIYLTGADTRLLDSTWDKDNAVPSSSSPISDKNNNGGGGGGSGGTNPKAMVGLCDYWCVAVPSFYSSWPLSVSFFISEIIIYKKCKRCRRVVSIVILIRQRMMGHVFILVRRCTNWIIPMMRVSNTEDKCDRIYDPYPHSVSDPG